jgi:hypothetical protein
MPFCAWCMQVALVAGGCKQLGGEISKVIFSPSVFLQQLVCNTRCVVSNCVASQQRWSYRQTPTQRVPACRGGTGAGHVVVLCGDPLPQPRQQAGGGHHEECHQRARRRRRDLPGRPLEGAQHRLLLGLNKLQVPHSCLQLSLPNLQVWVRAARCHLSRVLHVCH